MLLMVAYSTMFGAASVASTVPAWRRGMAAFQSKSLTGTNPSTYAPTPVPGVALGGGPTIFRVDTWNSCWINEATSEIGEAAAGGHNGYAGNEVTSIRLGVDAPATNGGPNGEAGWGARLGPTPDAQIILCSSSGYYADNRPSSRHTYQNVFYSPTLGRVMQITGNGIWCPSGTVGVANVDGFSLSTNTWNAPGTWPSSPFGPFQPGGNGFYDAINDVFYIVPPVGSNSVLVISFDCKKAALSQNPWASWQYAGGHNLQELGFNSQGDLQVAFDTNRQRVVYKDSVGRASYIACPNGTATTIAGGLPAGGTLRYDRGLDKLINFHLGTTTTEIIDPAAFTWAAQTLTGDTPPNINVAGQAGPIYDKINFAPNLAGFFLVAQFNLPVTFIATRFIG